MPDRSRNATTARLGPDGFKREDNAVRLDIHSIVEQAFKNAMPQITAIIWEELEKCQGAEPDPASGSRRVQDQTRLSKL